MQWYNDFDKTNHPLTSNKILTGCFLYKMNTLLTKIKLTPLISSFYFFIIFVEKNPSTVCLSVVVPITWIVNVGYLLALYLGTVDTR